MTNAVISRTLFSRAAPYAGRGYLGGDLPQGEEVDAPDGRARILNVPSRVRITVLDRGTMQVVGAAISHADGTWRVSGLSLDFLYMVIGSDERGLQNAAIQDWVRPALPVAPEA